MSHCVPFPKQNFIFRGEGCLDLPAHVGILEDGRPVITSKWRLTPEEAEAREVYVTLLTGRMPPIMVGASLELPRHGGPKAVCIDACIALCLEYARLGDPRAKEAVGDGV